jgi:hypothetical protein
VLESWNASGFEGHRYRGNLSLPGRYYVEGLRIERLPGAGRLSISHLSLFDAVSGRSTPVSLVSAFVSDTTRFRATATTPAVRLFELPGVAGDAWVVDGLRTLPDDASVLRVLRSGTAGFDPHHEALGTARDVAGVSLSDGAQVSRAVVSRTAPERINVQAQGPGLLVVAETWDPGWSATLGGRPAPVLRVNAMQMAVVLPEGSHRVAFRYRTRGLSIGVTLAGAAALGLLAWAQRRG